LKIEFEKGGGYFNKDKILRVAKITGLSESQVKKKKKKIIYLEANFENRR
jgi:hypothetical protein